MFSGVVSFSRRNATGVRPSVPTELCRRTMLQIGEHEGAKLLDSSQVASRAREAYP